METNVTPKYDISNNETNCCPKFDPAPWDGQALIFKDKLFVKAKTTNVFHIPLGMGKMYKKTFSSIQSADAVNWNQFVCLSHDPSPWKGEHFFAVTKEVQGQEMVRLTGNFVTKVFEGPFRDAGQWCKAMNEYVRQKGKETQKLYFFYTTCPKCAKHYHKNYVVGFAQIQ